MFAGLIPVDDAGGVSGIERVSDLDSKRKHRLELHGLPADPMLQRHAIEKLHGDEVLTVALVNFEDHADIGMVQRRSCLRLAVEAGESL